MLRTTKNLEIGNWVFQFSTSKFSVVLTIFETEQLQTGNCLVLSPIQFTPPTRTRQDKTVLSCPCRRCAIGVRACRCVEDTYTVTSAYHRSPWRLGGCCCWCWSHLLRALTVNQRLMTKCAMVVCWENWKGTCKYCFERWWTVLVSCVKRCRT